MRKIILSHFCHLAFLSSVSAQTITKHVYPTFGDFYTALSKNCKSELSNIDMRDTHSASERISANVIREYISFTLDSFRIKYVSYKDSNEYPNLDDSSFLFVNGQKTQPGDNNSFQGLAILESYKLLLNSTTYFILPSWAPACNGSFCRAEYDQVFTMKNGKAAYTIADGWQSPKNIYCDLNNDGQLDVISFIGNCPVNTDSFSIMPANELAGQEAKVDSEGGELMDGYFCIQALTLQDNQWVPLTDRNKKEYYVYIWLDDLFEPNSFKVLAYNWFSDL